jgi:hypothetical protein
MTRPQAAHHDDDYTMASMELEPVSGAVLSLALSHTVVSSLDTLQPAPAEKKHR